MIPVRRPMASRISITPTIRCTIFMVTFFINLEPVKAPTKAARVVAANPNPENSDSVDTANAAAHRTKVRQITCAHNLILGLLNSEGSISDKLPR